MNVNVYLEDSLAKQLNQCAKNVKKPRNTIIREAVKEWIAHHQVKQWPKSIKEFNGIKKMPAFETYRNELELPKEDPLA
jgi:metal-responsive CopG/Arc/MetJ family transcriptional regulator